MTTELFLGSLTILTLAGIIIIALTADDRVSRSNGSKLDDRRDRKDDRPKSDR